MDLSDLDYIFPFLVIWLSLILTVCSMLVAMPKTHCPARFAYCDRRISLPKLRKIILTCSAILIVNWIITIIRMGSIQNYFLLHWYTRFDGIIEQWGVFIHTISTCNRRFEDHTDCGDSSIYNTSPKKHVRKYGILIFALMIIVLNIIMTGNRIYIALLMLYIGTSLLLQRRFRLIFLFMMILPVFVLFFNAWSHVRGGMGDLSTAITNYESSRREESKKVMNILINVTEGSNVMMLLHIINDFGSRYDLLYGTTYTRAITFPIPRSIYPNRPQSFTGTLAELYEPEAHTSFNSTALGEMYANF